MNINKIEILERLREYKEFTTKASFAKFLEVKPNVLSNWYSRNTFVVDVLVEKFPEINYNWLLTGKGEMIKKEEQYNLDAKVLPVNEPSEVFKTKAGSIYTENSDGSYTITVPLVPFEAYASYVNVYNDEVALVEEWEKVSFNVDKIGLGKYLGFKSKGDSMNGGSLFDTPDKALILGREIGRHHWLDGFRHSDYGFILVTKFSMMHKDIIDFNKDKGEITCHSRNESPEYSDFNLNLNDVYQIFRVIKRTF